MSHKFNKIYLISIKVVLLSLKSSMGSFFGRSSRIHISIEGILGVKIGFFWIFCSIIALELHRTFHLQRLWHNCFSRKRSLNRVRCFKYRIFQQIYQFFSQLSATSHFRGSLLIKAIGFVRSTSRIFFCRDFIGPEWGAYSLTTSLLTETLYFCIWLPERLPKANLG